MSKFGNKIVVVGVSAVGKSTFSRKLAQKLHLPLIHMDSIMWKPGWKYIGDEETIRELNEISLQAEWIIEGYISKEARAFIFDRADSVVYLDYSAIISSWRYIKRCWKHQNNPRPELKGSPEKFSFKFLKLVWTKGEAISLSKYLKVVEPKSKIVTLFSPKQARYLLKSVE